MSYKKTLFVSETYLKNNSLINGDVDMKLLTPIIEAVQDINIQPILGSKLYFGLKERIFNDTVTQEDKVLLDDYITKAVLHGVMSESVIPLSFRMRANGVGQVNADNKQNSTLQELQYLKQQHKSNMQWYLERLDDFLCHNWTDYPEFRESRFPDMIPSRQPFTNNIFLGRTNREPKKVPAPYRYKDF